MLRWLRIRDFALIDEADIEFGPGLNVITGETGAGKSVLLGAVAMLLGERAETAMIRTGATRAEIGACVHVPGQLRAAIGAALAESGLELLDDGDLLVRRTIGSGGGRNFLNDQPVTLELLRRLGDLLIDLHGPHEHQSLLKPTMQLLLLDRYAGLAVDREQVAAAFSQGLAARAGLAALTQTLPSAAEAELLRSLLREIESAAPLPGEDEALAAKHRLAAGSREIVQAAARIALLLHEGEGAATERLAGVHRELTALGTLGLTGAGVLASRCGECTEAIRELALALEQQVSRVELDEREFAALEERMQVLQTLKRRAGPRLEEVLATAATARQRLADLANYDTVMAARRQEVATAEAALRKACDRLGRGRRQAATKFAQAVLGELRKLGFPRAAFTAHLDPVEPGPHGADRLEFLFSANPGEPAKPLRQIASSGEISRAMLALKTVLATADEIPILIFDEIDVNIGGETAGIVGNEMRQLAATRQVLCITHLPQVAACAETHFRVDKEVAGERTFTRIGRLGTKEREGELTRMLGGGAAARKHAAALRRGRQQDGESR